MKKVLSAFAIASLAACGSSSDPTPGGSNSVAGVSEARSSLARDTNPNVSEADFKAFMAGRSALSASLHKSLSASPQFAGKNFFFSPYSIDTALAMAYAGAAGDTKREMAAALQLNLADDKLHAAYNKLALELESRGKNATAQDGQPFRLRVNNSTWAQRDTKFETVFLNTLAKNYGAGVNVVDFKNATDEARVAINGWVAKKTEDKIKDMLAPGTLNPLTRLVLVNTVYFNAGWMTKFKPADTKPAPFNAPTGPVTVDMMSNVVTAGFTTGQGYKAVELNYDGSEVSMVVVVPDGDIAAFEAKLDGAKLDAITSSFGTKMVTLKMPKFKIEGATFSVKDALKGLGMNKAFTPGAADFTAITKDEPLFVSDVAHKSFVNVDENGTEAAAATAVIFVTTSVPESVELTVDKPFWFGIRDRKTGALVFTGRVVNPKG